MLPAEDRHLTGDPPAVPATDRRRAGFESLARAAMPDLARYLRRRTDVDTADDVLSDVLLVMWRRVDELDKLPEEMCLPWCYGVARKCLANARRSAERRERLWLRVVESPEARVAATGGHAGPEPDDDDLADALSALRDADREVLRLWAWEQLEPREIAVVLGITPNAASIRLHRATKRLREQLPASGKSQDPAGHLPERQDREQP